MQKLLVEEDASAMAGGGYAEGNDGFSHWDKMV